MKKIFKMGIVMLVVMMSLFGCNNSTEDTQTIKIGSNFELTGAVAEYGIVQAEGVALAVERANASGEFDIPIEIVRLDNKSDETETVTVATQLVESGVVGIVGPAVSGLTVVTFQVVDSMDRKVPVISPSATADGVTQRVDGSVYEHGFRACFLDSYQGTAMAVFASDNLDAKKVVIISDSSSDYAKGLTENFKTKFTSLGGEIVGSESYVAGDQDFNTILTRIKDKEFDAIYIPGYYNEVGLIIKQARDLGIDSVILGPDGFDSPNLVGLATAEALNNVYFTTAYTTVTDDADVKAFVESYKDKYNKEPNMFAALAYDATNLLLEAIKQAGSTDSEAVSAALANIEDFKGVTGTISFDELHNPVKSVLVVELVDGVQTSSVEVNP